MGLQYPLFLLFSYDNSTVIFDRQNVLSGSESLYIQLLITDIA